MRRRPATALLITLTILLLAAACDVSQPSQPNNGGFAPNPPSNPGGGGTGTGSNTVGNPGGSIPESAAKPAPPQNNYNGCPSSGDGGDPALNIRKDRTDSAPWYPVKIGSLLSLPWPKSIERRPHASWSPSDAAEVARFEGTPVQVEGWLAGAKQEGPESCNCHSPDDVDNHLWIVDAPGKDRSQAVVVEITPRVRATHPGWAFSRISPLVDGQTKVRISGWLLMDPEHPDQLGKTRGTIWEIHPIIAFDIQRGTNWVSLDTGRISTTITNNGGDTSPTEDPSLPPPIVETPGPGFLPTATTRPQRGQSAGKATGNGAVEISDIFYNGTKGQTEPDEYVEITNKAGAPANMDGWVLRDIYGGQEFTWHSFTLNGGQSIRVYTNEVHQESGGFSFNSNVAIWNNKGDAAELDDASGNVVSTFAYGNKK